MGAIEHALWLRGEEGRMTIERMIRDVRYGVRGLMRRPLFTATAILTLALGTGATTAVYSVVDAVLLAPLAYPGGERFVEVTSNLNEELRDLPLSAEVFTEWQPRVRALESMEAYATRDANLVGAGTPLVVKEAQVTAGFLAELLDVRPLVGRVFSRNGDEASRSGVVVVSEALWRSRFGARSDIPGATLRLDDRPMEVVGVVPRVDLLPLVEVWTVHPLRVRHSGLSLGALRTLGRMAPGVTLEQARSDLEATAALAAEAYPRSVGPMTPGVEDYRSGLVSDVRTHLLLLLGAVAAVLLISCVNVANLLLARGVERGDEFALRRSLGASRGHLVLQVLVEGLVLAAAGGIAGVAMAYVAVDGLLALLPSEMPLAAAVAVDGRVLAFACAVALGTGLLVGLVPMLRAARDTSSVVAGGGRSSASRRRRQAGGLLLGLEVAQACVLLVTAGLMVNTMVRMNAADSGFDPRGLAFAALHLPSYAYGGEDGRARRADLFDDIRERIQRIPGVLSVGIGTASPFSGMTFMMGVEVEGGIRPGGADPGLEVFDAGRELAWFSRLSVDSDYLRTLGLPVVRGRGFAPADFDSGAPVALINQTAAEAYWPGESPLGRRVRQTGPRRGEAEASWLEIVGVVEDFRHPALPTHEMAELYLPLAGTGAAMESTTVPLLGDVERPSVLIRHDGNAEAILEGVRRAVWAVDPELPIPAVNTALDEMGAGLATPRFYTLLFGAFAALAVVLASVGIYGVMSHSVARRTREIGIRLALGAPVERLGAMVLGEGMRVVGLGLLLGLAAAAATSRLLEGLLFGVEPVDPVTYGAVALLLAGVAASAAWVPARRAMRADPVEALRHE
jgi:putative ABC transport system permease protein